MELHQTAAEALLLVRHTQERLADLPEAIRPSTLDQAYAIQDASLDKLGDKVGGWKVSPSAKQEGRFCSVIPAAQVFKSPAHLPAARAFVPEIEVEIAVRIGRDLPLTSGPTPPMT